MNTTTKEVKMFTLKEVKRLAYLGGKKGFNFEQVWSDLFIVIAGQKAVEGGIAEMWIERQDELKDILRQAHGRGYKLA